MKKLNIYLAPAMPNSLTTCFLLLLCLVTNCSASIVVAQVEPTTGIRLKTIASAGELNPYSIVFDGEGMLWVADAGGSIKKFDPNSGNLLANFNNTTISGLHSPRGITFNNDGSLWISNQTSDSGSFIAQIDTTSGSIVKKFDALNSQDYASAITFDSSGGLWASGVYKILHLDTSSGQVLNNFAANPSNGFGFPSGLSFDDGGNLWIGGSNAGINKMNPLTGALLQSIDIQGFNPQALAFDSEGMLWTLDSGGNYAKKVDTATGDVLLSLNLVESAALSPRFLNLAFDGGGKLWVAGSELSIPEPTVFYLLGIGFVSMCLRRRK